MSAYDIHVLEAANRELEAHIIKSQNDPKGMSDNRVPGSYLFVWEKKCERLEAANKSLVQAFHDAKNEVRGLRDAALAYQELSTCYRLQRTPSQKLFERLENAKAILTPKVEASEEKK